MILVTYNKYIAIYNFVKSEHLFFNIIEISHIPYLNNMCWSNLSNTKYYVNEFFISIP